MVKGAMDNGIGRMCVLGSAVLIVATAKMFGTIMTRPYGIARVALRMQVD
jgi:hypothetical protein